MGKNRHNTLVKRNKLNNITITKKEYLGELSGIVYDNTVAPHKSWIQTMEVEAYINRMYNMADTLSALDYKESIKVYTAELEKLKIKDIDSLKASSAYTLWHPLVNATEFIVDLDTQENKMNNFMDKITDEIKDKSIIQRFKYPFEDIVITFQKNKKYCPYFITVFKMYEKYNNKRGEKEDILLIKLCITKGETNIKLMESRLPVLFEFQYIKGLFNKLIISCKSLSKTCKNHVKPKFNITFGEEDAADIDYMCLKSWNTCESCPHSNTSIVDFIPSGLRFARQMYEIFKVVCFVLDRYANRNAIEIIKSTSGHKEERRITNTNKEYKEQRIIKITTISNKYEQTGNGTKHGHHESPVEHIRRGHYRKLSSGRIVEVRESIVNKGNTKKPIYKITE